MKRILAGCLVAVGLVLAAGEARADEKGGRWDGSPQHQDGPAVVPQPGVKHQTPPSAPPLPSGVLNKPSGVLNKPSGVLNKPSGVIGTLPGQAQFAPKQNFVGGQKDFRRLPHDGNFHDRDFHRGFFRGRRSSFVVVYVNGAPCWYPVYTAYPYYYATPLSTYDSGYPADTGYVPLAEGDTGDTAETAANYGEVGQQWGQDLRRDVATWEQFVHYLNAYIINAAPAAQADFREAFVASYGLNGAAAYDKGADQAAGTSSQGPKIINMQSAR